MALTLSPYATGFPSDSLNAVPVHRTNHMSRAVSINMEGVGNDHQAGDGSNQYVEGLDMDMVATFGDHMDMNFAAGPSDKGVSMVDPDLQQKSDLGMHPPHPSSAQQHSVDDMFHSETGLDGGSDDDDDSPHPQSGSSQKRRRETQDVPGGFTYVDKEGDSGRRKIRIEYITDKSRRHITFSKRKAGIMKKAYELSILTGTQVLLLVVSETGLVYTFTTTKLQPLVTKAEGKNLIQACLNAPDGMGPDGQPVNTTSGAQRIRSGPLSIRPHKLTAEATKAMISTAAQVAGATPDEAEAHATAQAHANAQAKAAAALGNGSPSAAGRPKKRLPSKRIRTASTQSLSGRTDHMGHAPELIPPVPSIPDMHRQPSPSTHLLPHGQPPPTPNPLQSPLSSAGYHIPPEYQHPGHHGIASPTYPYPPTPTGPADYGMGQPMPPGYGYPQGHPPPQHPNFLVHPSMYPSPHQQQQHTPTEPRRMLPGDASGMRMGM